MQQIYPYLTQENVNIPLTDRRFIIPITVKIR